MAFQTSLPSGGHLRIENRGDQTSLQFQSGSAGQQQSQGSGFSTGPWTHPPTLFQTKSGLILRIEAESNHYLSLENGSARSLADAPNLRDAQVLPLQHVDDEPQAPPMKPLEPLKPMVPLKPIEPMKPMAPMKPIEPMKPMEMKMGSMHMSMGGASGSSHADAPSPGSSSEAKEAETKAEPALFCTNCGQKAQEGDHFCAKCGRELRAL